MTFDVLGEINYLAVLAAAVAYFAFGALWYTALFGRAWQRATGVTQSDAGSMATAFIGSFIGYFISAVALAAIARATGSSTVMHGIVIGSMVGLGLLTPMIWINATYERRPATLFWINAMNAVLGYTLMAIIVTVWR
ncbi:MAG TPA: DUF1761 domain-containing protein [Actinomycetota bacterium]|nr:DUF1761 domain-containing protein [Actinomycetota bacterium]